VADRGLTGVVLVGGRSRRFGSPKALAELDGQTLADRAWRLLAEVCDERIAVGAADDLPFDAIPDAVEGGGPLAGIVAALHAAAHDVALVIPVDMPLLTPAALRALADACRDVAIPQTGPLPGAYAKRALPTFERCLADGDLALSYVISTLETVVVELDEELLANVNEPGDLDRLR
jgi:molybdopterin-guanine dinucleotide biosynthesis protein A